MSRGRGKILQLVNITEQQRREVGLMDGWRQGVKRARAWEEVRKREMISHSSLSVCWQVHARIIKELTNVRGGRCNDSLMTLTGNFSKSSF